MTLARGGDTVAIIRSPIVNNRGCDCAREQRICAIGFLIATGSRQGLIAALSFLVLDSYGRQAEPRPAYRRMTSNHFVRELSFVRTANCFVLSQCDDYVNGATIPHGTARPKDEKKHLILSVMNTSPPPRYLHAVYCFVC
jgi:hypothetical protein